ncbi:MAG TPA: helix-turn-helix domain-containing protein [Streptosporangiaceae bacterium]|nr:helix-turn-helix domain-containing protein [Streptosporangiaceae bacterium]
MSIGESLAQARHQAGLTLTQVSQRTRIRETIIAGIEADDYSACGGDFYARGHIRAIARVAGIDSEPLIEEYDAARRPEETDEFEAPPTTSGRRSRWGHSDRWGSGGGAGGGSGGATRGSGGTAGFGQGGAPGQGGGAAFEDDVAQGGGGTLGAVGAQGAGGIRDDGGISGDAGVRSDGGVPGDGRVPGDIGFHGDAGVPGDTGVRGDGGVRDEGRGRGGLLRRGRRDRRGGRGGQDDQDDRGGWDDEQSGRDPDRWPGLGWLGRGYLSDPDGWDRAEVPGHARPVAYEPGPDPDSPTEVGGWRAEADPSEPYAWDDAEPAQAGDLEPEPPSQPDPGDWLSESEPAEPHGWDRGEPPGQPDQADDQQPGSQTDPTGWLGQSEPGQPHPWDLVEPPREPDLADDQQPDGQSNQDGWDRDEQPGPGQPEDQPEHRPDLDWTDDGWVRDDEPGYRGPVRASEPGWRGALGAWVGLGDPESRRLGRGQMATVWVVLAAVIGFAVYSFVFAAGHRASASGSHHSHRRVQATAHHHKTSAPVSSPSPVPSPAVALRPAGASAFGAAGSQPDNPGEAALAIDRSRGTAWQTDWYATSHFGNLYQGTGLMIDMGHPVTITSVQIGLGRAHGANFSLRVGNTPTLAALKTAASTSNAWGTVNLKLSTPTQGRYVLIWLTNLPRNPAGQYQASIYNVKISGQP